MKPDSLSSASLVSLPGAPLEIFQILEKNQFDTGSVHQMFQAAAGLQDRGHRVTIVSREGQDLRQKAEERGLDFKALPFRSELDVRTILRLRRAFREAHPDVIHVHKGLSHTLALAASWFDPAGAFVVNRGVSFPLQPWNRPKYLTRHVDRVVTVCQQIKEVVVRSGRLPEPKVEVVYAGVDLSLFDRSRWSSAEFRTEYAIGLDRFLIMQVGVRDWKGWRELMSAFAQVAARRTNAHLALIGCRNEEQRREVIEMAAELGIANAVTAVGYRSDMPRVLSAGDLVVDASWAGTGITGTIREAMALGKAVIATDCGGNRELISSAAVGNLIPMRNQPALFGSMIELMDNRERRVAMGESALDHVQRHFSKDQRVSRLETLYREIIASKSPR